MANRHVVVRRVADKPRIEARTAEIDCTPFAKLSEDQEAAGDQPDLDAEIEVVAALPDVPARAARFAHTLPREAPKAEAGVTDDEPDEPA